MDVELNKTLLAFTLSQIDKGNRDDDRDHTEKEDNSIRVQLLFERSAKNAIFFV